MDSEEIVAEKPKEIQSISAAQITNGWMCPNGHLLGIITKHNANGGGKINRLLVLARAYRADEQVFSGAGRCFIDSGTVLCSVCGAQREWRFGGDFIDKWKAKRG